jgi:hypothetical protein
LPEANFATWGRGTQDKRGAAPGPFVLAGIAAFYHQSPLPANMGLELRFRVR